jgi:hypothetical protein
MAEQYLPGATLRLLDTAPMVGDGGARTIWHYTGDRDATAAAPADLVPYERVRDYFSTGGAGMAPHLLWDPFTGRVTQFFPATSRAKAVQNQPGGVETNRKGRVCIQIEILFFPYCRVGGKVYPTVASTPLLGLDAIMRWLREWGVPDVWPMGRPTGGSQRSASVWDSTPGHYGHSQVPENDHTDPGPMPDIFSFGGTDMALEQQDVDRIADAVYARLTAPTGRDTFAHATLWWLNQTLKNVVPAGAESKWNDLVPALNGSLKSFMSGVTVSGVVNPVHTYPTSTDNG